MSTFYKKTDKMLELSGNAQIKQKNDTFRAQEISLNMDTQEITLDGRVKGSITDERKTEEPQNNAESQNSSASENNESTTNSKSN